MSGYTYVPGEMSSHEIKIHFVKGRDRITVKAECSGGRVEAETESGDD